MRSAFAACERPDVAAAVVWGARLVIETDVAVASGYVFPPDSAPSHQAGTSAYGRGNRFGGYVVGARRPQEAAKLFEERFAAGDLDGVMDLYEDGAVFTTPQGAHAGLDAIRDVVSDYLATGASLVMNTSVAFEADELALVHWAWTMQFPDGRVVEGTSAEVLRRQSDGSWKFVIDNGGGSALLSQG